MSDGVMTVALLKKESDDERIGIDHFGFWVDDLAGAEQRARDAGARPLGSRPPDSAAAFYEAKFTTPDAIVFDQPHRLARRRQMSNGPFREPGAANRVPSADICDGRQT